MKTPSSKHHAMVSGVLLLILLHSSELGSAASTIVAWGDGRSGQTNTPPDLTNAVALSASGYSLALRDSGRVAAWGTNWNGQDFVLWTVPENLSNVTAIAAGGFHSVALLSNGMVSCWGDSSYGRTTVPAGLSSVVAIAGGGNHSAALKADGTMVAWGYHVNGQTNVPSALTNVVAIACGDYHTMALRADGTVLVWGSNASGQTNVPAGLSNVVAISAAGENSMALRADGTVVAWGLPDNGQTNVPSGLTNAVAIAGAAMCLRADGTVLAWGNNYYGQTNVPAGLQNVTAIADGRGHRLALVAGGPPPLQVPVTNPARQAGGFQVSLPTQSGRVYRLEFKNSLSDVNWGGLPLTLGTGNTMTLTDPAATAAMRFYRVRRW